MNEIALSISKAIKEAKWLTVEYLNIQGETTNFWCSITDVNFDKKTLTVTNYNAGYLNYESKGIIKDSLLHFDGIIKANVIDHTTYEQPENLILKIEANDLLVKWLKFDSFSNNTMNYIKDCIKHDYVPYQKETSLVSGIDEQKLLENPDVPYPLTIEQVANLTTSLEKLAKLDKKRLYQITELVMNVLSINTFRGLFVAIYKELLFDPIERTLKITNKNSFNYEFSSDENKAYKHNLANYLDIETEEFVSLFNAEPEKAKNKLNEVLDKRKESLDCRPYILDLYRFTNFHIEKELDEIIKQKKENTLSKPLIAFFGNMDRTKLSKKRKFDIVLLDTNVNLNQLRSIHSALKQPVTYVQGPPGTGKTTSIINTIVSAFFNDQKVLITSNNNKPIDDIHEKLINMKSKSYVIPFPVLRLGNNDKVLESLSEITTIFGKINHLVVDDKLLDKYSLSNRNNMSEVNKIIDEYEDKLELGEEIEVLQSIIDNLSFTSKNLRLQADLSNKKELYQSLRGVKESDVLKHVVKVDDKFFTWLYFTSVARYKRLNEPKYNSFMELLKIKDDDVKLREFNKFIKDADNLELLLRVFPVIITTNQSAHKIGEPKEIFDLVIIDEAGQCSIGHSLLPISRGKRLMLVGDQNQLQPVISLSPENNKALMEKHQIKRIYNYVDNSILKLMQTVDTVSKYIMLNHHYRCNEKIINFSNKKYYGNKLIIPIKSDSKEKALSYININQKRTKRSNDRNTSIDEIQAIISEIKKFDNEKVGIITPFRNQALLLNEELAKYNFKNVHAGTIHTFQGDEKDTIYISSAINKHSGDKTFDWLKNNKELINVATTRAKKKLVLVGDFKEIKKRSKYGTNDFYELSEYVRKNGKKVDLTINEDNLLVNGSNYQQYNTVKEKELLKTLNHIFSIEQKYIVEKQVKISAILNQFTTPELFNYGISSVFDFVIFSKVGQSTAPVLVIELDGDEHKYNEESIKRDSLKNKICKDNNVEIVRITNDYSRRYVFIKGLIEDTIKQ